MVNASKGEGIAFLRQATGATAVVFAGDDTTDEDALGSLVPGDLGVKVGLDFTQAEFRVEAPVHVCELLEALLRERKRARWQLIGGRLRDVGDAAPSGQLTCDIS